MNEIIKQINDIVWSPALIYLCLAVGLYFSIRTRFMQVRGFKEMIRLMFRNQKSDAGVSSFQALAMSLSGRVGTGNIAGVASAIYFGGPGAVFWMWVMAFLGAATAYVESVLGQVYKEVDSNGQYRGGPAYYIEKAMGQKWYAWIFAIATVIGMGLLMPGVQSNTIASGIQNAWGVEPSVSACAIAVVLGFIIFGGVKRIAAFAEVVVPFMALGYILIALVIMIINVQQIPAVFGLILKSALGLEAGFGAVLGLAVQWGVKRGVYSNEAGQGSGPHAAAAAEVSHPAEQGYVQAFSVYVDTLLVCSATAFMMLSTGQFNTIGPDGKTMLANHIPGMGPGPGFTQAAVESVMPGFGASVVAIALMFFAFTTIVAYYYMAETNLAYLNRKLKLPALSFVLKVVMIASVTYGGIKSASMAWDMGDIGVGVMAWLNIIAILILQKPALACLRDYEAQRKAGKKPIFNPDALGIKNAELWHEIAKRGEAQPEVEAKKLKEALNTR
ncbi:alanine/glycine:cation symporter family protein [Chitinivorax sp. B]|uniref:alanine/glycine:cation symporter family protein n=1 Tax=Chitinivorax sp. B TaxID=2502235 RepID=UPI0010FA24EF|nr:alanine/glycine:cation symporter family protein [Chitinivorax sp. B]